MAQEIDMMFEVTPPPRRASAATVEKNIERISSAIAPLDFVKYINVPEVVEENRLGKPLFRNMDNREFGSLLSKKMQKEIVVNKITPHFKGEPEFLQWLNETVTAYGIRSIVFVGGSNSSIDYSGPSVIAANELASSKYPIEVGNISIPSRENECRRLLDKSIAKCSFFTTQVLFEAESVKSLLSEYGEECRKGNIEPSSYFLSFAPIADSYDLEFCKWLGAAIPADIERILLENSSQTGEKSIRIAKSLFSDILGHCEQNSLDIPLGLNIEPLSMHNLELGVRMAKVLSAGFK
ncbi:MAG: hypothetical protein ABIG96_06695 [Candidatus Micrarchaeota archaeon]